MSWHPWLAQGFLLNVVAQNVARTFQRPQSIIRITGVTGHWERISKSIFGVIFQVYGKLPWLLNLLNSFLQGNNEKIKAFFPATFQLHLTSNDKARSPNYPESSPPLDCYFLEHYPLRGPEMKGRWQQVTWGTQPSWQHDSNASEAWTWQTVASLVLPKAQLPETLQGSSYRKEPRSRATRQAALRTTAALQKQRWAVDRKPRQIARSRHSEQGGSDLSLLSVTERPLLQAFLTPSIFRRLQKTEWPLLLQTAILGKVVYIVKTQSGQCQCGSWYHLDPWKTTFGRREISSYGRRWKTTLSAWRTWLNSESGIKHNSHIPIKNHFHLMNA